MLVAMGFAYSVFSTAADAALSAAQIDTAGSPTPLVRLFVPYQDNADLPLYKRVRMVAYLRMLELTIWFVLLNLLGMFVARGFIRNSDIDGEQWDWMTTFYWAIQTTTTIGYGDLGKFFQDCFELLMAESVTTHCMCSSFRHAVQHALVPNLLYNSGYCFCGCRVWCICWIEGRSDGHA